MDANKDHNNHEGKLLYDADGNQVGKIAKMIEHEGASYAVLDLASHFNTEEKLFVVSLEALDFSDEERASLGIEISDDILANAEQLTAENGNVHRADRLHDIYLYNTGLNWPV